MGRIFFTPGGTGHASRLFFFLFCLVQVIIVLIYMCVFKVIRSQQEALNNQGHPQDDYNM